MLLQKIIIIRIVKYISLSIFTAFLLFIFFSGSEYIYIDTYSGRLKTVRKQFLIKQSYISDTDFSKLVENYKLGSGQEEWKLAISRYWGILRLKYPERICFSYGKTIARCREFVLISEMGYISKEFMPYYLDQLLQCMQEGRLEDMEKIVWRIGL
jgi:hypothetical protein